MKGILAFLITLSTIGSLAQTQGNRYERISKQDFKELLKNKDKFVPVKPGDTVVIVRYTGPRLLQMQVEARNMSFARNGTDTTGLKEQLTFPGEDLEKKKVNAAKFSTWYPDDLKKKLAKKGIASIIVDERDLKRNSRYVDKYWLKTIYVSDQQSPEHVAWVMTITNLFYDPKNNRDFEVFLPMNYHLFDLIK